MADKILNTDIIVKHGAASAIALANPVLMAGELGVETDTRKIKVGDGTTTWNNLDYCGSFFPIGGADGQILASDGAGGLKWIWLSRKYGAGGLKYGADAKYGLPYFQA